MFGASFLTFIWIGWGVVTAVFVVLMIWKSVIGVPEDSFVIFGAAHRQAESQHRPLSREQTARHGRRNTAASPQFSWS